MNDSLARVGDSLGVDIAGRSPVGDFLPVSPGEYPLDREHLGGSQSCLDAGAEGARQCRRYPPYSKWLGSAFARVPGTAVLAASLTSALSAAGSPSRERYLSQAYATVAEAHNGLGLTRPLDSGTRGFYDRPYQVLDAGRFATALTAAINDPLLRALPPIGAADQFMDSTDALGDLRLARAVISTF